MHSILHHMQHLPTYCTTQVVHNLISIDAVTNAYNFQDIMLNDKWQRAFTMTALAMDTNTADVEDMHAAHKEMTPPGSGMELLAAASVLRQVQSASRHLEAAVAPTEALH